MIEQLKWSHSALGRNDSRGVLVSWDGTTPGESFCPGMELTPGESFGTGMERLQKSHSVLG